jgi:hypothetical protein
LLTSWGGSSSAQVCAVAADTRRTAETASSATAYARAIFVPEGEPAGDVGKTRSNPHRCLCQPRRANHWYFVCGWSVEVAVAGSCGETWMQLAILLL